MPKPLTPVRPAGLADGARRIVGFRSRERGAALTRTQTGRLRLGVGASVGALALAGLALITPSAAAQDWSACLEGPSDTQATFERAARVSGVPEDVLLAVGYLGSRWSHNDGAASTSGGYGVMHLTDQPVTAEPSAAKGDRNRGLPDRAGSLPLAADITGIGTARLRNDPVANICGGAAVLASYQPAHHRPAARSLEQGGGAQRRHRRRGRGAALRRPGLRRAPHRRDRHQRPRRLRHLDRPPRARRWTRRRWRTRVC